MDNAQITRRNSVSCLCSLEAEGTGAVRLIRAGILNPTKAPCLSVYWVLNGGLFCAYTPCSSFPFHTVP